MERGKKVFLLSIEVQKVWAVGEGGEWEVSYDLLGSRYVKRAYSRQEREGELVLGGARKQLWLEGSQTDIQNMLDKHGKAKLRLN